MPCEIPPEAFEYRLGNRTALEWVIDQYQVKGEPDSPFYNDPNAYGDRSIIRDN